MTVPPRPVTFDPEIPPPGFETKFVTFWRDRPVIVPRLQLVHTNAAPSQGTIESAYNWANQPGSGHTIPHYQIDRDGRAAMFLPLNRKGIANYLAAGFSLGYETADTGTNADPTISEFTPEQAEAVAIACAYAAVLYDIPLEYPETWDGTGTASHTEPFGYPMWTNARGKTCPGFKKKAQVRDAIIPRAVEIVSVWTAPEPTPPEDDMKLRLARLDTNPYHYRRGDGNTATLLRSNEYRLLLELYAVGKAPSYADPRTGDTIDDLDQVPVLTETELDLWVGYLDAGAAQDEG